MVEVENTGDVAQVEELHGFGEEIGHDVADVDAVELTRVRGVNFEVGRC